jgi:hypothetical protein
VPPAIVTEAVTEPSIWRLRLCKEIEVTACQGDEFFGWRRLSACHHEAAGNIVDAVSVLVPGHDPRSVLKEPDVIGQSLQVPERRHRVAHIPAPAGAMVSTDASSR